METETITITMKETQRYDIIQDLINNRINGTEAGKQMSLSVRQTRRIKGRVKEEGIKGLIHRNRGKPSNQKLPEEKIKEIKRIMKKEYHYLNPTLAMEKLKENYQIIISKEKLRHLMIEWNLWRSKPRKSPKKRHIWRQRKDNFGEMEQFDGSYHNWFGKNESCLLLSVDDATGKITHAKFDKNESVVAVFKFWLEYFKNNGIPISIYLDKFSTYKVNHKNAVDNKDLITQFQRTSNQTGVKLITANSPQAKGRVERMNKTLQDRLVKELKLAKITTMEDANVFLKEYIPKFNEKFGVVPQKRRDLHKKVNKNLQKVLPQIFSIQNERKVCNDYTIMFKTQFFQLNEIQPTTVYKKDKVTIEEHLNGEIKIDLKGCSLNYQVLPERPKKMIDVKLVAITRKKINWKPPINHPWSKTYFNNRTAPRLIKQQI